MKTKIKLSILAAIYFQIMPTLVWASRPVIERTQMIFSHDPNIESKLVINSFDISHDGGFLLAGGTDSSHSLFLKINSLGKLVWKRTIDQKWPVYQGLYAFDSSDGGCWGIGYAYSRDIRKEESARTEGADPYELEDKVSYKYLLKMDSQGNPIKQTRLISTATGPDISCAVDVKDGLIFTGYDKATFNDPSSESGKTGISVPWIEKVDKKGRVLWHRIFSQDGDEVLNFAHSWQDRYNCRALLVSPSGRIIWATTVKRMVLQQTGEKKILRADSASKIPNYETFIFMLDQAGNEIHRMKRDDADKAFIFPLTNGFLLVEHFRPHVPEWVAVLPKIFAVGPIALAYAVDGGVRISKLDANLQVLKTDEYKIPALNDRLGDVLIQKNEEYFLAGCNNDGMQAVVHLNNNNHRFEVTNLYPENAIRQCADFGWLENHQNGDLQLYAGNRWNGYRLLSIKYAQ